MGEATYENRCLHLVHVRVLMSRHSTLEACAKSFEPECQLRVLLILQLLVYADDLPDNSACHDCVTVLASEGGC